VAERDRPSDLSRGKRVQTTGMFFCRIRGGQIVGSLDNWDALGLMEQLGALPHQKCFSNWRAPSCLGD
jgi:hypothetical protein